MLDAIRHLLCSKLCQHNRMVPSVGSEIELAWTDLFSVPRDAMIIIKHTLKKFLISKPFSRSKGLAMQDYTIYSLLLELTLRISCQLAS